MTSSQQIFVESFSLSLLAQQINDPYLFHISVLDSLPSHLLKTPAPFLNQQPVYLLHHKKPPLTPSVSIAVKSHTFHCCKSSQKNCRLPVPPTPPPPPSALILCPFPWTLFPQRSPLPTDPVLVLLQLNLTDLSTSSSLLENSLPLVVEDAVLFWFSFIYLSVLPPLLC